MWRLVCGDVFKGYGVEVGVWGMGMGFTFISTYEYLPLFPPPMIYSLYTEV